MRVTKSFFTLATIFALVSCSNEWEQTDTIAQLQLTTDIASTRADINATHFDHGDAIGVFAYKGRSSSMESWNVKATTDSKSWYFEKPVTLFRESTTVYAYYPWNGYASDKHMDGFVVDATSQTNYMVGYDKEISYSNPKALISFRHITSKVSFYITNNDAKVAINFITLNGENLLMYGYYYLDGGYEDLRSNASDRIYSKNITDLGGNEQKAEFLLFPDDTECRATLIVSYEDGSLYSTEFILPTLEANCSYAYNVNIAEDEKSSMIISDAVIASWDEPTMMDEITIEVDIDNEPTTGKENGHDWIDLGLPSGLKWATCNVGASMPEDYGNYFAWGETQPKDRYYLSDYKYCIDSDNYQFSKYVTTATIGRGNYGTVDNKTTLELTDDAAFVNWGGRWRMPTHEELDELMENCTWEWTYLNGAYGYRVTGKRSGYTDNSIFLPAAGVIAYSSAQDDKSEGHYWTSSLSVGWGGYYANGIEFKSDGIKWYACPRQYGYSVRPCF